MITSERGDTKKVNSLPQRKKIIEDIDKNPDGLNLSMLSIKSVVDEREDNDINMPSQDSSDAKITGSVITTHGGINSPEISTENDSWPASGFRITNSKYWRTSLTLNEELKKGAKHLWDSCKAILEEIKETPEALMFLKPVD